MRARKSGKKTAFVPRIIFNAASAVGVVPLCAVAACGGVAYDPGGEAGADTILLSVAAMLVDSGDEHIGFTVAAACFDGSTPVSCVPPPDAGDAAPDIQFTVAATCFDGGGFCPDAFGVADAAFKDVHLGVAVDAFALDSAKGKG